MLNPSKIEAWILKNCKTIYSESCFSKIFCLKINKIPSFFTLKNLGNILIVAGLAYIGFGFWPVIRSELGYRLTQRFPAYLPQTHATTLSKEEQTETEPLWSDIGYPPVNTDYAIIIQKINVNTPIISNVSVTNPNEYLEALNLGVAQAAISENPSDKPGNTYLFAHSTPNPLDIQKYSAVFSLLNKLENGDQITLFYQGKRLDYTITANEVIESFNLTPLTRNVSSPTLTLQTCDPPGIPINRRIVTAVLDQ